ncbi:MAG: DoxX family protein [Candidatus Limnocylindrales bacterium]
MIRPDRRWAPLSLAALFAGSGILHFARPEWFLPLIPRSLPEPGAIVALSGLAELVCAAGLVTRRGWAGSASAALLVAILPGNVQFALDQAANPATDPRVVALAWLRLPLQLPMIWAALQSRGFRPRRPPRHAHPGE